MRVHNHSFVHLVTTAEDYVGGLSGGAWNGQHFLHGFGHLAAKVRDDFASGADQRLGFVVEEARGADIVREFGLIRGREIGHGWIFLKQAGRHFVDALVGALRR